MIKKSSIALVLMLVVGGFWFGLSHSKKVHAATTDKITGYAWSTNVGWVRMNCENTTADNTCATVQYGVEADHDTGVLSGYAWSSIVGWISFNETSGCPSPGYSHYNDNKDCQPRALFSYGSGGADIVGWAQVVGSGEWISLSCLNTSTSSNTSGYCNSSNHKVTYPNDGGPSLSVNGGPLSGYAYGSGGTSVGWLDMSKTIWNIGSLFCDQYPNDPACVNALYLVATPSTGVTPGTTPGVDLEWGSNAHTAFTGACTASSVPASWSGTKTKPSSANSWSVTETAVAVPYPNLPSTVITYKITCPTGSSSSVSATADVDVSIPTWSVSLTANGKTPTATVSYGGSLSLVWSTTNAPTGTTCSAPIWAPGQSGTNVTTSISNVTNSANYTVVCTPPGGSSYAKTASVQVNVVKVTSFPQISCYQPGTNPVLTWSSENASACSMAVPGGSTVSGLASYSGGTSFTQGAGQYTLTCKDTTNTYTSGGNNSINATQCIPNFSINSSMSCNGNPNANGGIITDNAFQKLVVKSGAVYVAKIPVNITPQTGFNFDVSYTFLKPATSVWMPVTVKWASGGSGNVVVKTNAGGYADTLILTAPTLADMQALFTGVANGYQGVTVQAQRVNSTPAQLKPNPAVYNFSVCAPGGGGVKPVFIES